MRIALLSVMIIVVSVIGGNAQVRPNFPYSALGIGELNYNAGGVLSGMGNATSALRSEGYINNANPASYSALPRQVVLLELSGKGSTASLKSNQKTATSSDFGLNRFSMAFKVNGWWGTGFGVSPVSTVSYQIAEPTTLDDQSSETVNSIFEGNGGLNQAYWANGIQIGKHFSAGVQAAYVFGSINDIEKIGYDINNPLITSTKRTYLHNFRFSYGAQLFGSLSKKWDYTIGAALVAQSDLTAQYDASVISGTDTLSDNRTQHNYFTMPTQYRGGIALTYNKRLTFSLDYAYEDWHNQTIKDNHVVRLINSTRYGAGIQYIPAVFRNNIYAADNLLNRLMFEGAFNYNNSYLRISNEQVRDMNVSLGTGISSKSGKLSLHLGFEVGRQATPTSNIMSENYVNFYCTFILRDIWFVKTKFY